MLKVASPNELRAELKAIMAFIHASEKPDRQVVAGKLRTLANRVAGDSALPEGFEPFDDNGPSSVSPLDSARKALEKKLGESPGKRAAKGWIRPSGLGDISAHIITFERRKAWAAEAPNASNKSEALRIGKRVHKNLKALKDLSAAQDDLHSYTMYVYFPGGYVQVPTSARG